MHPEGGDFGRSPRERRRAVPPLIRPPSIAISQPIDPDLAALRTTICSLIEGGDDQLPAGGAGRAVEVVDRTTLGLKARWERLLARSPRPSRLELEELLTESCTRSYFLEAQRLRTKRLMVSALADASPGPPTEEAREELRELVGRYYSITEELERIEVVIAHLRARMEKM